MKITKHKQAFGAVAKEYKQWRGGYNKKIFDLVFSLAPKQAKIEILDVGCGVGNSTEPLATPFKKYGFKTHVTGVDPDGRMLVEARKSARLRKLSIDYIEAGAEKMPFQKDSFDLAVSGAAFHWFATKKALGSIKRVLKPNGVYVAFWNLSIETGKPPIGVEFYRKYKSQGIPRKLRDADNVKKIFTSAGFKKVTSVKIPFTETKTVDEIIGSIKTNSTYALLSITDRKDFISGMRKAHKHALNGKNTVTEKRELVVVYGVK